MNLYLKLLLLLCFTIGLGQLSAQEKKIRIKAEKEVNGVMTEIDTTIVTHGDADMKKIMEELGLEMSLEHHEGTLELHKEHKGKTDGDETHRVKVIQLGDGNTTMDLQRVGEGEEKTVEVTVDATGDGENKFIIKVNGEEVEADGEHKVIIHKEGEEAETHNIWIEKDGDKKEFSNSEVFFFSDEEMTDEQKAEIEEIKKRMENGEGNMFFFKEDNSETIHKLDGTSDKNITIDIQTLDEDGNTMLKIIKINCIIEELKEEDEAALRKAGILEEKDNSLTVDDLSFYPNPNDGRFNLGFETKDQGTVNIRVVDVQGKGIYQETLPNFQGAYDGKIDISSNPQGVYFLSITQNGKVVNKKIVIE